MKRQADSVLLLAILYLASTLATVQASIQYVGPKEPVPEGQPWRITCYNPPGNKVAWKKNDQTIPQLTTAEIGITPLDKNSSSSIYSDSAKEEHMGFYQCGPGNETFQLLIKSAIKYKVLTADTLPIQLNCENRTENDKVTWTINDKPSDIFLKDKTDAVTINEKNGTLSILSMKNTTGKYVCDINGVANASTIFRVVERPHFLKVPLSVTVVEGEKLSVLCTSDHHGSGLKVKWLFAGKNYTADEGRVKLLPNGNVNTGKLSVENIGMNDRGNVSCYVAYDWNDIDNPQYAVNATTTLRVKDKLAALWPFLGICAEVVVLCAIILIYEKKRNKSELEESDTDQSPDTKPPPSKDSDVRQRK